MGGCPRSEGARSLLRKPLCGPDFYAMISACVSGGGTPSPYASEGGELH